MKIPVTDFNSQDIFSDDSELPDGWHWEKLQSKVFFQEGPGLRKKQFKESGIPFLNIRTLKDERIDKSKCQYLDPDEVKTKYSHFLLDSGDIIVSSSGSLGKTAIISEGDLPLMLNTSVIRFRSFDQNLLSNSFLHLFLKSKIFMKQIEKYKTGSAQFNFGPSHLKMMVIPLPPLDEQQRIVARIEALLSHVDAAGDRLSRVPAIMKRFRQSVLAAACSGRLTEEWREENQDIETAEITLEQIQTLKNNSNLRKNKSKKKIVPTNFKDDNELQSDIVADLPPTWIISNLENITSRITSGSRWWKKYYCNDGPGTFILSQNVRPFYLNWSTVLHVDPPENDPDRKRSEVQKDDLLITIAGNTGDVCRVREDIPQHYVCQSVAMVRPVLKEISPYLEVYLNSPSHGQKQFDDWAYGEGRPHLSFDQLKKTTVLLPPLAEQREIVRRVGLLFERANAIEREVVAAGRRCERLTQGVLGKAFRGELSRNNDESN